MWAGGPRARTEPPNSFGSGCLRSASVGGRPGGGISGLESEVPGGLLSHGPSRPPLIPETHLRSPRGDGGAPGRADTASGPAAGSGPPAACSAPVSSAARRPPSTGAPVPHGAGGQRARAAWHPGATFAGTRPTAAAGATGAAAAAGAAAAGTAPSPPSNPWEGGGPAAVEEGCPTPSRRSAAHRRTGRGCAREYSKALGSRRPEFGSRPRRLLAVRPWVSRKLPDQ